MSKYLRKGVIVFLFMLVCSAGAHANLIYIENTVALGNPITNESGANLAEGSLVQLIRSDDSSISAPDNSGIPTSPEDVIIRIGYIGSTPESSYNAGEVRITSTNETNNTKYYGIRVWNASTAAGSTKYGTSALKQNTGGFSTLTSNPPSFGTVTPFSGAAPNITLVKPAVTSLTNIVTVEGTKFGDGASGDYISINGVSIPYSSCISWDADSIVVTVTSAMTAGTDVAVLIHANGLDSNTVNTLDINPVITSTNPSPLTDLITGISNVQLNGGGFGTGSANVIFNAQGTSVTPATSTINVLVPAGATDGVVSVEVNGRYSNSIAFTMKTPTASTIIPSAGNVGDPVTISGVDFGIVPSGSRATTANRIFFNGAPVPDGNVTSWINTAITFNIPSVAIAGVVNDITVRAGGHDAATILSLTVTPEITSVVSPYYIGGPTTMNINGTAFGATKGTSTVDAGGIGLSSITWGSTQVRGHLPSDTTVGTREVRIIVNNSIDYPTNRVVVSCNPYINNLSSVSGDPGDTITLYGNAFGDTQGTVQFGSGLATVKSWSNTTIEVVVPALLSGTYSVVATVTLGGVDFPSNGQTFNVGTAPAGPTPTITGIRFNTRPYLAGEVISSMPRITAIVTCDGNYIDTSYCDVKIDGITFTNYTFTLEADPSLPPGYTDAKELMVRFLSPIPAQPIQAHNIEIVVRNLSAGYGTWVGNITVMSGQVQMIGVAYNYPNPFKPLSASPNENTTNIMYSLNVDSTITVIIYDITGREVHRGTYRAGTPGGQAGVNQIAWNGRSLFNETVGNGMYLYKIIGSNRVIGSGKLVVHD